MLSFFRSLIDRLKVLFAVRAAQELEADLLLREAECKADLLRQADLYDAEGLHSIGSQLRQQAEGVSVHRPLALVLPALEHLAGDKHDTPATPLLSVSSSNGSVDNEQKTLPSPRKKGARS